MNLLSLNEAREQGNNKYYTGIPCKRGHITYRYTKDRACSDCVKLKVKKLSTIDGGNARRWANKTQEQKDIINEKRRSYYEKTRDARLLERKKAYIKLKNNPTYKQKIKEYGTQWKKENVGKVNNSTAKRRAAKLQRTPKWLTPDDCWMIEQAYELAILRKKMFGFDWHVDHVIPLQGDYVSGLHVPTNLQVIPGRENESKSNKYLPA
jgi:hypothetical protein